MSSQLRPIDRERRTARCQECGATRLGITRLARGWVARGARREHHLCDECVASIDERPLDDVLADYVHDQEEN